MDPATVLAQDASARAQEAVLYGAILLAAVLVLAGAWYWLRRRLRGLGERDQPEGFSLEDLEAMRSSGQISDEEFRRLRRGALGLAGPAAGEGESGSSGGGETDDG